MASREESNARKRQERELSQMLAPVLRDDMRKIAAEAVGQSARPKTEQELRTEAILATLDQLGGAQVGEDSILFVGTQIILPEDMVGKMDKVVQFLMEYQESQDTHFNITRTFNFRPYDMAAAFDRAMKRVFGVSGVGRAQFSFFGVTPPEYISVNAGPGGKTIQVPWEKVEFSLLEADFYLEKHRSAEHGIVGRIRVDAPKKNRKRIEGFFKVVEEELRERSLYRGQAITAHPSEPEFIDLTAVDPRKVIYTEKVEEQLEVNLWAPLRFTQSLRDTGVPLKRAVLLHGPNGTGKTLAGGLAGQIATQHGWTYILVRAQDDALAALETARMYSPSIVMIEDLDTMASATGNDRDQITTVLDRLDNVQAKGAEVMVIFTSNYASKLDKNVVRPGRLDAVIAVEALDSQGYQRLVKALIPADLLSGDVDYDLVDGAMHYTDPTGTVKGFLPAFATEAIQRSLRYSIARNQGRPDTITTGDLVAAAEGMAEHIALMDAASQADTDRPTIDAALTDLVTASVQEMVGTFAPKEEGGDLHGILEGAQIQFDQAD